MTNIQPDSNYWSPAKISPPDIKFTQITAASVDGVYTVGADGMLYKWHGANWQSTPIKLETMAIATESTAAIDLKNKKKRNARIAPYINAYNTTISSINQYKIPTPLNQIIIVGARQKAGAVVLGLDQNGTLYHWSPVTGLQKSTANAPVPLKNIAGYVISNEVDAGAALGELWAIGSSGSTYKTTITISGAVIAYGNWQQIEPPNQNFTQIAAGTKNAIWAVDKQGNTFFYNEVAETWNDFEHGHFQQLGIGKDGSIWGITPEGAAYRKLQYHEYYTISCEVEGSTYYLGGFPSMSSAGQDFQSLTWYSNPGAGYVKAWRIEVLDGHDHEAIDVHAPTYRVVLRPQNYMHALSPMEETDRTVIDPKMIFDLSDETEEDEYIYFYLLPLNGTKLGADQFQALIIHEGCGMPIAHPAHKQLNPYDNQQQEVVCKMASNAAPPVMTFTKVLE